MKMKWFNFAALKTNVSKPFLPGTHDRVCKISMHATIHTLSYQSVDILLMPNKIQQKINSYVAVYISILREIFVKGIIQEFIWNFVTKITWKQQHMHQTGHKIKTEVNGLSHESTPIPPCYSPSHWLSIRAFDVSYSNNSLPHNNCVSGETLGVLKGCFHGKEFAYNTLIHFLVVLLHFTILMYACNKIWRHTWTRHAFWEPLI